MTKGLISLVGLLGTTTISAPIINNEIINVQAKENFKLPVDWEMKPTTVTQEMGDNETLKFVLCTIDLTSLKIDSDLDFRYFYTEVQIPEVSVSYNGKKMMSSDAWDVQELKTGDERWSNVFKNQEIDEQTTVSLDRGYWLYYSVVDRHLMLRLSYRASMVVKDPAGDKGGTISFSRGSNVHIH